MRQQVAVLKRKRPRPKLRRMDRLFWTALRRIWSRWAEVLPIVKPETVVSELASRRISAVLELAVLRASWQSHSHRRNPRTHPKDGTRESGLGGAQNPR